MEFVIFLVLVVLGMVPGFIAETKGRSFLAWWLYGIILFPFATIHAIVIKTDEKIVEAEALSKGARKCPFCAEVIKSEATICRYCHQNVPPNVGEKIPGGAASAGPEKLTSGELLSLRLAVRIGGVFLVVLGLSAFGYYNFQRKQVTNVESEANEPSTIYRASSQGQAPIFFQLDNKVVKLKEDHVAQIGIAFEVADTNSQEILKAKRPALEQTVIDEVAKLSAEELLTTTGKEQLKVNILAAVASVLGAKSKVESPVKDLLFSSFIVQ